MTVRAAVLVGVVLSAASGAGGIAAGCSSQSARGVPEAGTDAPSTACALAPGQYSVSLVAAAGAAAVCVCSSAHACNVVFDTDAGSWADSGFIDPVEELGAIDVTYLVPYLAGDASVGVLSAAQDCLFQNPSPCVFSSTCGLGYSSAGMGLASTLSFTVADGGATGTQSLEVLVSDAAPTTSCAYDIVISAH